MNTSVPRERVLFLIHDLRPGGAERVFLNYVRGLQRYEAIPVLVRRDIELLDGIDPRSILDLGPGGGTHAPIGRAALPVAALALVRKTWRLRRHSARHGARVVSTFLHKAHFIALTAAMFDRRMRVVLNVHELMSQHIEQHFRPEQRSLMRALVRRFYPRAHAIVAVAEGVRRDLIEQFGIPARLITVVRNPLDLKGIAAQAREPLDPLPGGRNIVAVGRLVTLKGLDVLIDAFAQLPATLDAHLLIVGEGPEEARLRAQADRLRVAGRVHFLGQQRNPWKYMVRADALALPSRTEGFPNVIGEALALGVPVVAADCSPGVREYLEDGSAGLLVPPDNVIALTHALVQVLTDGALSARLRDYGPRRVSGLDMPAAIVAYEGVLAHALRA